MSEWIRTGQAVTACHLGGLGFVCAETIRRMVDSGELEGVQIGEGLNYRLRRESVIDLLERKAPAQAAEVCARMGWVFHQMRFAMSA